MATINTLKADNNSIIRAQVAIDSIDQDEVADRLDAVADELLARGIAGAPTTAAMSTLAGNNYKRCIVKSNGTFEWLASGAVDGTNVFTASGGGVWSRISTDSVVPSIALDDLSDVVITDLQPGDAFVWNGSEWVNQPRFYEDTDSTDIFRSIENDRIIVGVMLENTTNLVGFKVGTTFGADNLVPTQPALLADSPQFYSINLPTGPGLTLYFGGITDTVFIKTYLL